MLGNIAPETDKRAWTWYRRGIRRGFIAACDALLKEDGELTLEENTLRCNNPIVDVSVSVKLRRQAPGKHAFRFKPEELGFRGGDDG